MALKTRMEVPYSYLTKQFDPDDEGFVGDILVDVEELLRRGEFTLGGPLDGFEQVWAETCGVKHAIGVGNGTDALYLIMRALGIGNGSTVLTVPNTFVATVGAILQAGARPLFTDVGEDMLMPVDIEDVPAIPSAILPVWWAGNMPAATGAKSQIPIIEDACQAIGAETHGQRAGSIGIAAAFSLHPLKNVNVWGDGGVVTTDDDSLAEEIRLLRNHGLSDRDTWAKPGVNSRLDTIQAIVGLHVLRELDWITERRRENAARYTQGLASVSQVQSPVVAGTTKHAYHLYVVMVDDQRDEFQAHLQAAGVETKVHYPVPLHLQPALRFLRYKKGDFPNAERQAERMLSLPIHQYLEADQIDYTIESIHEFYRNNSD